MTINCQSKRSAKDCWTNLKISDLLGSLSKFDYFCGNLPLFNGIYRLQQPRTESYLNVKIFFNI